MRPYPNLARPPSAMQAPGARPRLPGRAGSQRAEMARRLRATKRQGRTAHAQVEDRAKSASPTVKMDTGTARAQTAL